MPRLRDMQDVGVGRIDYCRRTAKQRDLLRSDRSQHGELGRSSTYSVQMKLEMRGKA